MSRFLNLFKKRDGSSSFIPLEQVQRYTPLSSGGADKPDDEPAGDGDDNPLLASGPLPNDGCKNHTGDDLAPLDTDGPYVRKSKVINKAIQDMGMGRYQWELFVLCGMGWLADKSA